jgi:hypothetical protein
VAVARGKPLPAADEVPDVDTPEKEEQGDSKATLRTDLSEQVLHNLTVPISSRTQSFNSDSSANPNASTSGNPLLKGRTKALASFANAKSGLQSEIQLREIQLPKDPNVNGQPIEAFLYKDASECPICFLYYPPYLNKTRCCDQDICSECFVQIKRPDPHPPEHGDSTQPQQPRPDAHVDPDNALVSEPAACPFCALPEFGVTYEPPRFRRGLAHANSKTDIDSTSGSLHSQSNHGEAPTGRRRATSLAANDPTVITTDKVRPDWAAKLANARAHAARRSAAATALHTAAYLMSNRPSGSDSRLFGRRVLRRGNESESTSERGSSTQLNMLSMMAERYALAAENTENPRSEAGREEPPTMTGPPRQSSRRNRMDDLEEMMMMEAIRLSLAAEEERRKREEKEAKKESKKKAKEEKKAEKAAKKNGLYLANANQSSKTLEGEPVEQGKGKEIARPRAMSADGPLNKANDAQSYLERSRAQIFVNDSPQSPNFPSAPFKPSHLRTLSNVSSSASSMVDTTVRPHAGSVSSFEPSPNASGINIARPDVGDTVISGTPPGGGAGTEPMFNFRSLAAMIDDEDKQSSSPFIEHAEDASSEVIPAASLDEDLSVNAGSLESVKHDEPHPLAQTTTLSTSEDSISSLPSTTIHGDELGSKEIDIDLAPENIHTSHSRAA